MKPLALDLCCGTGGWTDALLAAGWRVVGVDIYRHPKYQGELILSDLHEFDPAPYQSECRLVVASPPCDEFSRHDKPWTISRRTDCAASVALVERCKRIAADLGAPLVLENVRAAQQFIGTAANHYASFYLWGDGVPAMLPRPGAPGRSTNRPRFKVSAQDKAHRARIPCELAAFIACCHYPKNSPTNRAGVRLQPVPAQRATPSTPQIA